MGLVYYNLGGAKVPEIAEKARWSELYDGKSSTGKTIATVSLIMGCVGFITVVAVWFGVDLDLRGAPAMMESLLSKPLSFQSHSPAF